MFHQCASRAFAMSLSKLHTVGSLVSATERTPCTQALWAAAAPLHLAASLAAAGISTFHVACWLCAPSLQERHSAGGCQLLMICPASVCRHQHLHCSPGWRSALHHLCTEQWCHRSVPLRKSLCWLFMWHLALPVRRAGQIWSVLDVCAVSAVA